MNRMRITVPAQQEWALVLRTALGGVGTLAGLSVDMIDDLKTASDEAFNLLINQMRPAMNVTLYCDIADQTLSIRMQAERAMVYKECTPVDPEVAHLIIGTLVTDVHLEGDRCGIHSVHMKLPSAER